MLLELCFITYRKEITIAIEKTTRHREEEEDQGDHRGSGEGQRERGGATQEKRGEGAGRRGMSEHLANMTKFDVNFL